VAAFAALISAATAVYVGGAVRGFWANHLAQSTDPAALQQAVRLEPLSAEYAGALGTSQFYSSQDPAAALNSFRRAAALNPYNGTVWLHVANAALAENQVGTAVDAVGRALQAEPTNMQLLWSAGGLYLVTGDTARSFHTFRTFLQHDPGGVWSALDVCWRAVPDTDIILRDMLPPTADVYLNFISFLIAKQQPQAAMHVWSRMLDLGEPFDPRRGNSYVQYWLDKGMVAQAWDAWQQMRRAGLLGKDDASNLVTNGGFEQEISNTAFTWQVIGKPNSSASMQADPAHTGKYSALMVFEGDLSGPVGVYQSVVLRPSHRYRLSFFVKTEGLRSAVPLQVAATGAGGAAYAAVDTVTGTSDWTNLRAEFTSGDNPGLTSIVVRVPGQHTVLGKLWLDDVSLVEMKE
jgi:tetratricopeptide (TPR) repeat protein